MSFGSLFFSTSCLSTPCHAFLFLRHLSFSAFLVLLFPGVLAISFGVCVGALLMLLLESRAFPGADGASHVLEST